MTRASLPLLCAAAAFALAVPAFGAVAPPVIHEPFTPLPCPLHPDTDIDLVGCAETRILRTDRQIDTQVGAIFRLLRTDPARRSLAAGERAWLQYRRQWCAAEASRYAGGLGEGLANLQCTLRQNRSHLHELAATRSALAQH